MAITRAVTLPQPTSRLIEEPPVSSMPMTGYGPTGNNIANIVISVASAADIFTPWGTAPRRRDAELRAFWPTEPYFASGLFTSVAQYAAFEWALKGPPKTVSVIQDMLATVQGGAGWEALMSPFLIDYFTTDNGSFMEIVRVEDQPDSPVLSLNHLDSFRCIRTGRPDKPVIYMDLHGTYHELNWWNVLEMTEMPSPIEEARGLQYCVLTRMLRGAQLMRDIGVVKSEKASGRFTRQVHLVSGIQTSMIDNAVQQKQVQADSLGLARYIQPLIIGSIDPTAKVSKETIDLASLPDEYDEEKGLDVYIKLMAMAFGTDYQNFAPLSSSHGGLGSSSQGKVMNMRSRGKGPAMFMAKLQRAMNFRGILPRTVTFQYGHADMAEQMERVELDKERALKYEILIRAGVITTQVGRQMAVDEGVMDARYLVMMREDNTPSEVTLDSDTPPPPPGAVKPGLPGPDAPPAPAGNLGDNSSPAAPPNSNAQRNRAPSQNQKRQPGGTPEGGARA